jgi:hypothetical protein
LASKDFLREGKAKQNLEILRSSDQSINQLHNSIQAKQQARLFFPPKE